MSWTGLVIAFAVGGAIGGVYLVALWWSVRNLRRVKYPAVLLIASGIARVALIAVPTVALFGHNLPGLITMIAGFIAARVAGTRIVTAAAGITGSTDAA